MPLSSVVGASSILRPGVCTSTSRPASPFEGQTIYETDTDTMRVWNGSAWRLFAEVGASINGNVVQVVSTAKTDTFTVSSSTYTDVTGLSASITPSSSSSKVLVMLDLKYSARGPGVVSGRYRLMRDSTAIYIGDSAGSRTRATGNSLSGDEWFASCSAVFLDSPNSTSSLTYKAQISSNDTNTTTVNRSFSDSDLAVYARGASSITVMEISA